MADFPTPPVAGGRCASDRGWASDESSHRRSRRRVVGHSDGAYGQALQGARPGLPEHFSPPPKVVEPGPPRSLIIGETRRKDSSFLGDGSGRADDRTADVRSAGKSCCGLCPSMQHAGGKPAGGPASSRGSSRWPRTGEGAPVVEARARSAEGRSGIGPGILVRGEGGSIRFRI